jgi:hypothetical protein
VHSQKVAFRKLSKNDTLGPALTGVPSEGDHWGMRR